jgi:hypothetical protein
LTAPPEVVQRFAGIAQRCIWQPLANAGGFSGAQLWRGEIAGVPQFALKRWPADCSARRLKSIHRWLKDAEHLPFVPKLVAGARVGTTAVHGDHVWDITQWMPGEAKVAGAYTEATIRAACEAISQLHDVWNPRRVSFQPCPALTRRLQIFDRWNSAKLTAPLRGGWREAESLVRLAIPAIRSELKFWLTRPLPVQPCLTDIHRDHVLFTGDTVTGIIDYGAMKFDNVAVDAARFLGDAAGDDETLYELGCDLFVQHHGEDHCPRELITVLDRTGTLGAIANWLLRDVRTPAVEARLVRLIERWKRIAGRRP